MNRFVFVVLTSFTASFAGQQPPAPAFDVASVRPSPPGPGPFSPIRIRVQPGGRLVATRAGLEELIRFAYSMEIYEAVTADASTLLQSRFDINASSDRTDVREVSSLATGSIKLMLQNLLAERFHLRVRWEKREQPTLALVRARPNGTLGSGLRSSRLNCASPASRKSSPAVTGDCQISWIDGRVKANGLGMSAFADFLSRLLQRPVFDRTNLSGPFVIDLVSSSDGIPTPGGAFSRGSIEAPVSNNAPALATALKEQLGLSLELRREPIRALVVEHLEPPSEN